MKEYYETNAKAVFNRARLIIPFILITILLLFVGTAQASSLTLPSSLKTIDDEAFMGDSALESVILPDGIEHIGERAFADSSLVEIYLPNSLQDIAENAFDNHIPALIIKGYSDSLAESYAQTHDIMFVAIDNEPTVVLTSSWSEFANASSEMIQEYSTSVTISSADSKYPTGRLIVKTNDDLPDISQFRVAGIVRDPENHYLMQFLSDIDADDCANYLATISNVIYVEPDALTNGNNDVGVEGVEIQSNSWGVSATYADEYAADLKARGITSSVVVAVVDTGVDSSHSMLRGRIVSGYDFIDNDTTPQDGHGHGTHVAGTIVDCTPGLNVSVMPVRVLGNNGSGSFSCVAQGIRYAARSGASVINLSLGGGHSSYVDEAVTFALNKGVIVIVAAGNESDDTSNHCPAHITGCITVAAVNSSKQKAYFSNYGNAVDIAAPGVGIKSSIPGGGYATWNGTSMATPHVSAAAAMLILDHYSNIETQLRNAAEDLGATGWDRYYGAGFLCLKPFIKGQKEYTINYDPNGGTGAPDAQTKTEGKTIALSTSKPTRLHIVSFNDNTGNTSVRTATCTFLRWNTKSDGSGTNYSSGASYSADESTTLYAQWNLPTIGTLPQPTREGYTFDGWYTSSIGGTKISNTTTVSSDVTFYAHWTQITYEVSYNANGGTGAPSSQTKGAGTAITLSSTKPTRSHIITLNNNGSTSTRTVSAIFHNWNTAIDGSETSYNAGGSYNVDASATLYAQWTNATVGTLPTPTRTGYTFQGWYTAASGGTKITSTTAVTSDTTYYAHWQQMKLTLNYTDVTVNATTHEYISVFPSDGDVIFVSVGETAQPKFNVNFYYGNAPDLQLRAYLNGTEIDSSLVTWSRSSNYSWGLVDDTGRVYGSSSGGFVTMSLSATTKDNVITATLKSDPSVSASVNIHFVYDAKISLSVANTSIATVSSDGTITGKKAGTTTLIMKSGLTGKTATCPISVGTVLNAPSQLVVKQTNGYATIGDYGGTTYASVSKSATSYLRFAITEAQAKDSSLAVYIQYNSNSVDPGSSILYNSVGYYENGYAYFPVKSRLWYWDNGNVRMYYQLTLADGTIVHKMDQWTDNCYHLTLTD